MTVDDNNVVIPGQQPQGGPLRFLLARTVLLLLFGTVGIAVRNTAPMPGGSAEEQLTAVLAAQSELAASPSDVYWIDSPPSKWQPYRSSRAWVLAAPKDTPNSDVFLVRSRRAPEGAVLDIRATYNLTRTRAADERHLTASGSWAAYTLGSSQEAFTLGLFNLNEPAPSPTGPLSRAQRLRLGIARLQSTGNSSGLAHHRYRLEPPAKQVWLDSSQGRLQLWADGNQSEVVPTGQVPLGGRFLSSLPEATSRPGNWITWAVDRFRQVSWFGDERMQLLKAVAYRSWDALQRQGLLGPAESDLPSLVELGSVPAKPAGTSRRQPARSRTWPPQDLAPLLDPAMEGEGVWLHLDQDPFVRKAPSGRSPFLTTFIRPDPDRKFSRVVIALWDPQEVQLHMQSGTEEPTSATGEHGSGLIPREPHVMSRLLGAFNGGFQGSHGDFGMQVEGTLYVPPKPYAATVATLTHGETAFGTWPAAVDVPVGIRSFRQNLTPLVQDGKLNPYGRLWWGGVPQGWEDDTRSVRSALCLTADGHVAYFYGAKVDHVHLGKAMLSTRCDYGLHLDMNQGHTGLEFYSAAPTEDLPPLAMPLSPMWQSEGPVTGLPGFRYRGRRLFRSMQLMNFPRYIQQEARDFFYLTLRPSLAQQLAPTGLPNRGKEPMGPWTELHPLPAGGASPILRRSGVPNPLTRPETKVHQVALSARELKPVGPGSTATPGVLQWLPPATESGELTLWWNDHQFHMGKRSPLPTESTRLAYGTALVEGPVLAAVGLHSRGNILIYAEIATRPQPTKDGALLRDLLAASGCTEFLYLSYRLELSAAERDLGGHPAPASTKSLAWIASKAPMFQRIFKDTPVTKRRIWKPLQLRVNVPSQH